jgi:hypothetical protein
MNIDWYVIGVGGGNAQRGDYSLNVTIAQPLFGRSSSGDSDLCSGFWCLSLQWINIFIPIIFGP